MNATLIYACQESAKMRSRDGSLELIKAMNKESICVVDVLECIGEAMCNDYCKYPGTYNAEEHDGVELWDSDICRNCPINILAR